MARFNKKAVVLYAALQKGKKIPVTLTEDLTTGTVATQVGKSKVIGLGTKFVTEATVDAYIYTGTSEIGRIKSIDNDNQITLYEAVPASPTLAVAKVSTAKSTAVGTIASVAQTIVTLTNSSTATIGASVTLNAGDVIISLAGAYVGTVATTTTGTSIPLTQNAKVALLAGSTGLTFFKATAGVSHNFGLGNSNAFAVFTTTGSPELTTDSAEFTGDELNRDMILTETDRFWKQDFEIYMPSLGELELDFTVTTGTGTIKRGVAATKITGTGTTFLSDGISEGTKLYTASEGAYIGTVDFVTSNTLLTLKSAALNITTATAITFQKSSVVIPTPDLAQMPYRVLFEMLGLNPLASAGQLDYTNSLPGDDFLELEYRMSSADQLGIEKVRRCSDVVGTLDLTLDSIGKRIMLKLSTMGNYEGIFGLPARIPNYGSQKFIHADPVNSTKLNANVIKTVLVPYTSKARITFAANSLDAADTLELGGLVFTASGTVTRAELVELWSGIPDGTLAVDLDNRGLGTWNGTLSGYTTYSDGISTTSIKVQASDMNTVIHVVPFTGTAVELVNFTSETLFEAPELPSTSNICIGKMSVTNFAGFVFNRFSFTCETGWSKGATQGSLSISITEGAADTSYEPENFVGVPHVLQFSYGSEEKNNLVTIVIDKATLENVGSSELADFKAQDLSFKITGNSSIILR